MTIAKLKKEGKVIVVFEGYDRFAMFDDGRVVKEGSVKNIRSKYVWIDEEKGVYYMSIIDAYLNNNSRKIK